MVGDGEQMVIDYSVLIDGLDELITKKQLDLREHEEALRTERNELAALISSRDQFRSLAGARIVKIESGSQV